MGLLGKIGNVIGKVGKVAIGGPLGYLLHKPAKKFARKNPGLTKLAGAVGGGLLGGPLGALAGGGLGSLLSGGGKGGGLGDLGGALGGTEDQAKLLSNLDPKQKKLLGNYLKRLGKNQGRGFRVLDQLLQANPPSNFRPDKFRPDKFKFPEFEVPEEGFRYDELENPILEKWQSQILPSIMERFAALGNRNSSGLQQTLGQAGRGVARDLGTLYADILNKNANMRNENAWKAIGLRNSNAYNQAALNSGNAYNAAGLNSQNAYNAAGLNSQNRFNALNVRQNALNQLLNANQMGLNPGYNQPYIQGGQQGVLSSLAPAAGNLLGQIGLNSLQKEGGFLNTLFGGGGSSGNVLADNVGKVTTTGA